MINKNDTICALSTPRGKGGIAVIRVSGENALTVTEACFLKASRCLKRSMSTCLSATTRDRTKQSRNLR